MSKLKKEIKSSLQSLAAPTDFKTLAVFNFPKKFIGFKGHFPNRPILPGVCKIQAALLALEERRKKNVRLSEILQAKFFAPATFNQELTFSLEEEPLGEAESSLTVKVTSQAQKIAELRLRVYFLD